MENKNKNSGDTKARISSDYLKNVINIKNVPSSRQKLLIELIEAKVDHRTLINLKSQLFDSFPTGNITMDDWRKESARYLRGISDDLLEKLIDELKTEDGEMIDRVQLVEFLDTFQFLPIKIKRDKNKSENLYFIMNSNKRDKPLSKEEHLQILKSENDKGHLQKILTLIGMKLDEKFHSIAKAFLFFDQDMD
jgi:Ca2+-binding EF-hand superfamily protein